jgi:photosystem II stability/assembly factor-like uncharacterized protein
MKRSYSLALFFVSLSLLGASCAPPARNTGFFLSVDQGTTWQQRNLVQTDGNAVSLANESIQTLVMHPSDSSTLYAGTSTLGLVKTVNAGESWQQLTTSGSILAFAIHPQDTDKLIASRGNQIFLSTDGGEVWSLTFTNQTTQAISDLQFDPLNTQRVYASSLSGDIFVSDDSAKSWSSLQTFDDPVTSIHLHRGRPNLLMAVTTGDGVFRSTDRGLTWENVTETIQKPFDAYTNPLRFADLTIHYTDPSDQLLLTNQGLFHTNDSGDNWQRIAVLDEQQHPFITSVAWDPQNQQRLYYFANQVLHRSLNFGASWETVPFTTDNRQNHLIIDPSNSQRLYLGTERE